MFDDFMQNDFSDLNLNQAQQDAMLHAQNQAMDEATRALHEAGHRLPEPQQQAPSLMPASGPGSAAARLGLRVQMLLKHLLNDSV